MPGKRSSANFLSLCNDGCTTGWKGNKCHPLNNRRGRLKGTKNVYTIWCLNLIVSSEKGVSCSFCSRRTAYIVRDNAKKIYISRFIFQGHNLFLKNYVFDVVYIKSNSITC